jgi:tetratricopeptide (TPR) repeat protein
MDNFERLFKEPRKHSNINDKKNLLGAMDKEISEMTNSDWFKMKTFAVKYYQMGDYSSALSHLDQAIKTNPDHYFLFKLRAKIKEDSGNADGAILDYKESLSVSTSDSYSAYNQIAINYLTLKEFERALLAFDIAIELKESLLNNGIDETVIPSHVDGVPYNIDGEKMYTNRANVKLSLEDYQGCLNDCKKAIEINPDYSNSYFIAGLLFSKLDINEESLKALKKAESLGHTQATYIIQELFG